MSTSYLNRLGAIDFSHTIERLAEGFTGREWLFNKLDDWLKQDNGEKFYLLTGEPGVGKSALAAQLTKRWADEKPEKAKLAAYHFCRAGDVETVRPGRVLRSLATQLGKTLPHYGEALKEVLDQVHLRIDVNINIGTLSNSQVTGIYVENLKELDPREEFRLLIQAPLAKLSTIYAEPGKTPPAVKVFLIDSLDEAATTTGQETMLTLLASLYQARETLPPWVRFLLTARPNQDVLNRFLPLKSEKIEELEAKNLSDIQQYIQGRVDDQLQGERSILEPQANTALVTNQKPLQQRLKEANLTAETLVQEVKDLSHGNFLYTKLLLNSIASGEQSIKNLSALPKTLNDIYHCILRYRCSFRGWIKRYQPILGTLSVTQEPISQAQLSKFIRISTEELKKDLGVFQQFLDESKDEQGQPLYTIFHQSLREYLLDRNHNHDFWCDAKEQHDNIIERCERESQNWQDLRAINLYGLRHLAQHLVKGDRTEQLHMLLKLEQNNRNAWFDAKDISSYQADIQLAWEQAAKESVSSKGIALQFHYTLITASLNSLTTQIPLELLVSAVEYDQWLPEKGLSFALQIPDAQQKVATLIRLANHLPPALKAKALQSAIEMLSLAEDEKYKAEAFTELVVKLTPELLSKALDFALSFKNGDYLEIALSALAPYLNCELLSEALQIFFTSQSHRIEILAALAPHLSKGNLWSITFKAIPSIQDDKTRADALLRLSRALSSHDVEEIYWATIFDSILSILDGENRSEVLALFAPTVPKNYLESALEIALTTWYFPEPDRLHIKYDSQALEAIAPRLSPELISDLLDIEKFKERTNADVEKLRLNMLEEATQETLTILDVTANELVNLCTWDLPEETYTQVISVLAPYLTSNLFPKVVETLLGNSTGENLVQALIALIPYYPNALESAYKAAQQLTLNTCVWALMELVPHLPITELQVLEARFKEIEKPIVRQMALSTLIPYLPKAFFYTLQATTHIEDEFSRLCAVKAMEPEHVSLKCLPLLLELSSSFEEEERWQNIQSIRAEVLIHFLPYLPELFPFTWNAVVSINGGRSFTGDVRDEDSRVLTTRKFISAIPPELISQALDKVVSIQSEPDEGRYMTQSEVENDFEKAFILEMLAPRLTSDLLPKALEAALGIVKFENRELALLALACALPKSFPLELEALKIKNNPDLSDENKHKYELRLRSKPELSIIFAARSLGSGTNFLKAMVALAPYFPGVIFCGDSLDKPRLIQSVARYLDEEHLIRAITLVSEIKNTQDKVDILLEISKYLSSEQQYRILEALRTIKQERLYSQTLICLIPFLPKNLFEEVLSLAMSMSDEYRLPVLVALIPYVPEALSNALVSASSVRDYYSHSQSLLEVSKYLSESWRKKVLNNALKVALNISQNSLERVSSLVGLVPYVQDSTSYALNAAINDEYFSVYFHNYLEVLAPYLNEADLITALEAAKQLDSFGGYKYRGLMALFPYLPESISELLKAIFDNNYIGIYEIQYLVRLAIHESDVIPTAVEKAFKHSSNPNDFVKNLKVLVPCLDKEHITKALDIIHSLSVWLRAFALKILLSRLLSLCPEVLRELVSIQASSSESCQEAVLHDQYQLGVIEELKFKDKIDVEIFFKVQEVLESIKEETQLFYVYVLTELNPELAQNLIEGALEKPLLWDFPWDIQEIVLEALVPCMTHDLLRQILEEDPTLESKAAFLDYASRSRHHALILIAPYLSTDLFEKALDVSMLIDDNDKAETMKALFPKLSEHQLDRAQQVINSIQSLEKRTDMLLALMVRRPTLLGEVLQNVFAISSKETRLEHLTNLLPYLPQISTTQLFLFWINSLTSIFPSSRSFVLEKVDVLAPIAHQLGGDEAIEAITDSIDCATRWWR
jgi:hypothetical protein